MKEKFNSFQHDRLRQYKNGRVFIQTLDRAFENPNLSSIVVDADEHGPITADRTILQGMKGGIKGVEKELVDEGLGKILDQI
jgi:hypothetical protein